MRRNSHLFLTDIFENFVNFLSFSCLRIRYLENIKPRFITNMCIYFYCSEIVFLHINVFLRFVP